MGIDKHKIQVFAIGCNSFQQIYKRFRVLAFMNESIDIDECSIEQLACICDHTFLNRTEAYVSVAKKGESPIILRDQDFKKFLSDTLELKHKPYSVCVRPEDVAYTKEFLDKNDSSIKIASVVGFPYGYETSFKVAETMLAIGNGASEIDMVIDHDRLKNNDLDNVKRDITSVVKTAHERGAIVKVILETSELDDAQIMTACRICDSANADFVKTSTGYSSSGATTEALSLMRKNFSRGIKMSGGVRAERVKELLHAVSGRQDGKISLDPMHIRIGESKLLTGGEGKY
jgi:deoxyribose-phosphate aldolase